MTHYHLSKSPYLNQLINNLFTELQTRPSEGRDLTTLQCEIVEEISHTKINVEGRDIEMQELIEQSDTNNPQEIFPELMSFVLMKVIFKMKDKAMTQFISAQDKNVMEYKIVVAPRDVFRNFIHSGFYEFTQRPETRGATLEFIKIISKKFQSKVLMMDDIDESPEVTYGKMILLEDGNHVVTESRREHYTQFSRIIMELLLRDKEVNVAFAGILRASLSNSDERTVAFTRALVKDYIALTVKKLVEHEPFYTEQPLQKFINHLRGHTATVYVDDTPVEACDFVEELARKQFNPQLDNKDIMKKLGF